MGEQAAIVLTEAVRSINNGIRGFYYAIAALFLFAGPYVSIAATLVITGILYYRQLYSPTARAKARAKPVSSAGRITGNMIRARV